MDFLQRRKKDLNTFALEVGRDFGLETVACLDRVPVVWLAR